MLKMSSAQAYHPPLRMPYRQQRVAEGLGWLRHLATSGRHVLRPYRSAIRAVAVERFGVDRMVDRYVTVYEHVIANSCAR